TPFAHRTGLKHQLTRLGDGHEETRDFRVCYGDRTTLLNLLLEHRNYRAVGTQHISKTGGDKTGLEFTQLRQRVAQRLYIDLCNTLGATHDVRGVDSLIR